MKIIALSFLLAFTVHGQTNIQIPSLTVRGVSYTNATLRVLNSTTATVTDSRGGAKVLLSELPEPYRTQFFDPEKIEREAAAYQKAIMYTTNVLKSPDWVRVSGGKIYNTKDSPFWVQDFKCEFLSGDGDCAKVQTFHMKETYGAAAYSPGGLAQSSRPVISRDRVNGTVGYLINYAPGKTIAEGQIIYCTAKICKDTNIDGKTYRLWDCGLPNQVQVVTTNYPARAN